MCLILFAHQLRAELPLMLLANRDEYLARATAPMACWAEAPDVVGGRDLVAGGSWLGAGADGRWAAVTNVREGESSLPGAPSRGWLVRDYLQGRATPEAFIAGLVPQMAAYAGFNLLVSDGDSLRYASNRGGTPTELAPGIYGLSNHLLDSPWPKLVSARRRAAGAIAALPDHAALFSLLADDEIVRDDELPATGVPLEWERLLSAIFVRSADYGTRASTVVTVGSAGDIDFAECSFAPGGVPLQSSVISTAV